MRNAATAAAISPAAGVAPGILEATDVARRIADNAATVICPDGVHPAPSEARYDHPPKVQPATARPRLTMLPDPPEDDEDYDTQQHRHATRLDQMFRHYFRHVLGREDVLVTGEGYLCRTASEARTSPRPDCVVALGVPLPPEVIEDEGNGYTIDEIGKAPDFVLEVASRRTARRDETVKRERYAGMQVREYWRFDGSGRGYYRTPLAGDRLEDGKYAPIPVEQGVDGVYRGYSAALGLELQVAGRELRLWDPVSGEYVPDLAAAYAARLTAEAQRDAAEAQRDAAEARTAQERAARLELEARLRELET